jgi:O-antigen ligase
VEIKLDPKTSRPSGLGQRASGKPGDLSLNGMLMWLVLAILLYVPFPLGSNRPPLWAVSALLVGIVGLWYFSTLLKRRELPRVRLKQVALETALLLAVAVLLAAQALPIAGLLPASFAHPQAATASLSLAPGATWLMLLQVCGYGVFGYLLLQVGHRRDRARTAVTWLFSFIVAYGAVGLLLLTQMGDTWFGIDKQAYPGSATGPFINRNSFATFLAFGVAAGCALLTQALGAQRRKPDRIDIVVLFCATLLAAVALLATNSRMGIASGLVGALVALILGGVKLHWNARRWIALGALVTIAAVGLGSYYGAGVLERVFDTEGDLESRLALYRQIIGMIGERPWLGIGGGAFAEVYPIYHEPPVSSDFVWDRAHSTYLALWAELGIIGGTLPMLILLALGLRAGHAYIRSEGNWGPGLAGVATLVVAAMHSSLDFSLEIQANAYYLIAFLALGGADNS